MKKLIALLISLLLFVTLVACSGNAPSSEAGTRYESFNNNDNRPYSYSEDYKGFYSNLESGLKALDFEYENPVRIVLDVVTESGKLDIKITDSNGNEYFNEENLSTNTYEIILDKADTYTMTLTADNHSGSFSITATDI